MEKWHRSKADRRLLQKMTPAQRQVEFARRYAIEKQLERESGHEGIVYSRSLMRKRQRRIQRIQRIFMCSSAVLILIFLMIVLIRTVVSIVSDSQEEVIPAAGNDINTSTPISSQASTEEPITLPEKTTKALIVLDAGHGGYDDGANYESVKEKDLNFEITNKLKEALEQKNYEVYMTRTDDTFVGLNKRAELANEQDNPFLFISIHQNSYEGNDTVNGVEVWCYNRNGSNELAGLLVNNVATETGARDRGVYYSKGLVVTREANMPACIVECGYLTNSEERGNLQLDEYQQKIVQGIAKSVDSYYDEYYGKNQEDTTQAVTTGN